MVKVKQQIFIDDSGDPGFKFDKGSSRLFVIACVIFYSYSDVKDTDVALKKLKNKLGWKKEREFKFHRADDKQKRLFFGVVKECNFKIQAVVVDKYKFTEPTLKKSESFYKYVNKGDYKISGFKLVDSRDSTLIQLADMVAGAIGAKYDKSKRFKHDYLRMLKSQVEDIRFLGKQ